MLCEPIRKGLDILMSARLNPCYSGICSVSLHKPGFDRQANSLNPCYSGICSVSDSRLNKFLPKDRVLILVIVEYAL